MQVINVNIYRGVDFAHYQDLPGTSFSDIRHGDKDENFTPSDKMLLGSEVDCFLFTPAKYVPSGKFDQRLIRGCARAVKEQFGAAWVNLEFQLSVTADFEFNGMVLKFRGRPDGVLRGLSKMYSANTGGVTVDLKVSEKVAIEHMNYAEQLTGYSLAFGNTRNLILAVNPKTFATTWHPVPMRVSWWEKQVIMRGVPKGN